MVWLNNSSPKQFAVACLTSH